MVKVQHRYACQACGYITSSYLGKCPSCEAWGSLQQEEVNHKPTGPSGKPGRNGLPILAEGQSSHAVSLNQVTLDAQPRFSSGFVELDRVLGGGILPGAYVLIGGDPGIGKSTLMLQMVGRLIAQNAENTLPKTVLYIAGEESPQQIKLRAERLGVQTERVLVLPETQIHLIVQEIQALKPDLVIVDSIQALYSAEQSGAAGSMSQVRACASWLMDVAKSQHIAIFLVGHVTKDGQVAGPKLLEHTVDTVLYLEGDKFQNLRLLRSVKNRFGSTHELGVFEMGAEGLAEVSNPSRLFLSEYSYLNQPGSVITATLEGSRPILVELQALVGQSVYTNPRRVANGVEANRLHQIIAVLERRVGLDFSKQDIYVNVVGGLQTEEPAADLAIALAIVTSARNVSITPGTVVVGEIGLTGEIRPVSRWEARLSEAQKLGFERMVLPWVGGLKAFDNASDRSSSIVSKHATIPVKTIVDAMMACLSGSSLPEKTLSEDFTTRPLQKA